jgi:hypothetical protein
MGGTTDDCREDLPVIADRSEPFTLVREFHSCWSGWFFHDGQGGSLEGKWLGGGCSPCFRCTDYP